MGRNLLLRRTELLSLPKSLGPRRVHSRSARYAFAILITAVATLLRLAADPLIGDQIPYFIYVAAVVVATWFCGFDGGILAGVVSGFAGDFFFVPPRYEILPHGNDWIALSLFWTVSAGLIWQVGRWAHADMELRNMTARLRVLHAEAERVNRLKDEFLATLSHELRTPLNAIVGWSHILRSGKMASERLPQALDTIDRNARALTVLVNDVLDVSRIITGQLRLDIRVIDPANCVRPAVDALQPAADAKHISVETHVAPGGRIMADPARLQQIVWNLVSNAVKFTPKGGRVDVTAGVRESTFVIEVSDNGQGIKPEFQPYLFERFTQQDGTTTRTHSGLGLGLAIVRHLAELHGGSVQAHSAGEGTGARFTVVLPMRAVVTGEAATAEEDRPSVDQPLWMASLLEGIRVVAVDDEPDARTLVATTLRDLGAEVRTAATAAEALALVQAWRPGALVADIGMPERDGYWLIREVRSLPPDEGGSTPAVALTAYARAEDRQHAFESGFQEHLAKPALPTDLGAAVARVVAAVSGPAS